MMKVPMLKFPMRSRRVMPSRMKRPPRLKMRKFPRRPKRKKREKRKMRKKRKKKVPVHWPNPRMRNFSQMFQLNFPSNSLKMLMRRPKRKSIMLG